MGTSELPPGGGGAGQPARHSGAPSITPIRAEAGDAGAATQPSRHRRSGGGRLYVSRNEQLAIGLLAAVAAVVGALAPGAPTGSPVMDVVLKAALAGAATLAGVRTPWTFLALASAVVAVGSVHSPGIIAAVGVLGLALAGARASQWRSGLGSQSSPAPGVSAMRAAGAAVVAQLAMRLDWPGTTRATAVLALLALLLVFVPAVACSSHRVRRLVLAGCGLVVLFVVIVAGIAGIQGYRAKSVLAAAVNEANTGLHAADSGKPALARSALAVAGRDFATAYSDLNWAVPAEYVPVLSQQVRSVRLGCQIGEQLSQAGLRTAAVVNTSDLRFSNGLFPIATLRGYGPVFRQDVGVLQRALARIGIFHSPWLLGPVKEKLDKEIRHLREAVRGAQIAVMASKELPVVLGANGPQRYLMLIENPAESRASGGVIGDYAILTADKGRLKLQTVGSVEQLNAAGNQSTRRLIGPTDYIDRYSRFEPQLNWENVPMSPDFPSVAEVAANLYPQSGGGTVNGVISVDPVAFQGFLRMTGALHPQAWTGPVDSNNVMDILGNQEFVRFGDNDSARVQFIHQLVRLMWHALTNRRLPDPGQMAFDLKAALLHGHLQLWSSTPGVESFYRRVNVAGAMPPVRGDFVGVVTQNAAGNKLDWYLRRSISYDAQVDTTTHRISSALTIRLVNHSPSSGLPAIVINPAGDVPISPGTDELYVSCYSPWLLTDATVNGRQLVMTSQRELGRYVYSALVTVPPGGQTTLRLHYAGTWPASEPAYHLGFYDQPVLFADSVSHHVTVSP